MSGSSLSTGYLVLSAMLFALGAFGLLRRRNPLVMLMCVELMLNAVNLTFVTFGRMLNDITGQVIGAGNIGHILNRHFDRQVQRAIGGRINHLNRLTAAEKGRYPFNRSHRGGKPDALGGLVARGLRAARRLWAFRHRPGQRLP